MIASSSFSCSRGALLALCASLSLMPSTSLADAAAPAPAPSEAAPSVSDEAFLKACRTGDAATVQAAIDAKLNLNQLSNKATPLTNAILFGHEDVAKMLIDAGADINIANGMEQTPLMLACYRAYEQLVQKLIAAACQLNEWDKSGNTALLYACPHYQTKPELVKMLLQAGAQPEACSENGSSALAYAFNQNKEKLIELFLSKADTTSADFTRSLASVMRKACSSGKLELVKRLIALGASPVYYNENHSYSSPLQTAISANQLELVRYLLEQGAGDWSRKSTLNSLSYELANLENLEIIKLLIAHEFPINATLDYEEPLLFSAIQEKNKPLIKLLLEHGADTSVTGKNGQSVKAYAHAYLSDDKELMELLTKGDTSLSKEEATESLSQIVLDFPYSKAEQKLAIERVKELVELGANPNEVDYLFGYFSWDKQRELIEWLVAHGADLQREKSGAAELIAKVLYSADFDGAKQLIALGADINQRKQSGQPALWSTLENARGEKKNEPIIKFVQELGFDFHATDHEGRSILFLCDAAFLSPLLNLGLDINKLDNEGNTPLLYALQSYNDQLASALIKHGAKTDIVNYQGKNMLLLALNSSSNRNNKSLLAQILDLTSDLEARDSEGNTAYLIACNAGNLELIQTLIAKGVNTKVVNDDGENDLLCALDGLWRDSEEKKASVLIKFLLEQGSDVNVRDKYDNTILHTAANRSNTNIIPYILSLNTPINARNKYGQTALNVIADTYRKENVPVLLQAGADPNIADDDLTTPLMRVCAKGSLENAKLLVEAGALINAVNESGTTPLMRAMGSGSQETVDYLISQGADTKAKNKANKTMLMHAARGENIKLMEFCLGLGDQVNDRTTDGKSPLIFACEEGDPDAVKFFIEHGADIHVTDMEGQSPLMDVCSSWDDSAGKTLQCLNLLVKAGVDVNVADKEGKTALIFAHSKPRFIFALLEAGADVNHRDEKGRSIILLLSSSSEGRMQNLDTLCALGASMADTDLEGKGLLHYIAQGGRVDTLKQLIKAGWDVNAKDKLGRTPLYIALKNNSMQHISTLIELGADINCLTEEGATLMHTAASCYSLKALHHVNNLGLDLDALDHQGRSPLFYAYREGYASSSNLLLKLGADITRISKQGQNMLHAACMGDSENNLKNLIEQSFDVNALDEMGNSPYLLACELGNKAILETLLAAGAKTGIINKSGKTELMASCQNRYFELFELVLSQGGDINATDELGKTALIYACSEGREAHACTFTAGNFKVVQALHTKGADWTLKDKNGKTAADYAKIQNNPAILKLISEIEEQFSN